MVATIVISLVLLAVVGLIVASLLKRRKSSSGGCGCGCEGCSMSTSCCSESEDAEVRK